MAVVDQVVKIEDILTARENRVKKQQKLISKYNHTLISFTLNIPGNIKFNNDFKKVFDTGYNTLIEELKKQGIDIIHTEKDYLFTGSEGYFVVNAQGILIKRITINIEENHYLGRLFDMDVITNKMDICSRKELGASGRKCFLCGQEAHLCGRSRLHSIEELRNKIDRIINQL